jgi:hypothetical protein
MSEWCEYWTPEEYAEMQEVLTPGELEEELSRMRAKAEHHRVAAQIGLGPEEAALMRLYRMRAAT